MISNSIKNIYSEILSDKDIEKLSYLKILVVHDSLITRNVIVNALAKFGITNVEDTVDGKNAFLKLMEGHFNLLITYWITTNMNGLELTRAIRKNETLNNIYTFIISARNNKKDVIKAKKSGVNEYIIMPFKFETLINKIKKIKFN